MACVKRRRGRWVVDFRDQHGTRRWKSFERREDADGYLSTSVPQVHDGTYVAPREAPTFGEVADRWFADRQDRRPGTLSLWHTHIENHLKPAFGTRRITTIQVDHVDAFKADRLARGTGKGRGLKPSSVNAILTTASAIFAFAVTRKWVTQNPVQGVHRCRTSAEVQIDDDGSEDAERSGRAVDPREVLTAPEMQQLIDAARAGFNRAFLHTACLTGVRAGELAALRWEDINLDVGVLTVRRSISWVKRSHETPSEGRFYRPKTKSGERTIRLAPALVSTLTRWQLACPPTAFGLVFPTPTGDPRRQGVFLQKLKSTLKAARLPARVTVHGLRHSCASALLAAGVTAPEVAALLGHSSPAITMAIYAHWVPRQDSDPMGKLVAAMGVKENRGSRTVAVAAGERVSA